MTCCVRSLLLHLYLLRTQLRRPARKRIHQVRCGAAALMGEQIYVLAAEKKRISGGMHQKRSDRSTQADMSGNWVNGLIGSP